MIRKIARYTVPALVAVSFALAGCSFNAEIGQVKFSKPMKPYNSILLDIDGSLNSDFPHLQALLEIYILEKTGKKYEVKEFGEADLRLEIYQAKPQPKTCYGEQWWRPRRVVTIPARLYDVRNNALLAIADIDVSRFSVGDCSSCVFGGLYEPFSVAHSEEVAEVVASEMSKVLPK